MTDERMAAGARTSLPAWPERVEVDPSGRWFAVLGIGDEAREITRGWVRSIDRGIAWTNARYAANLEQASRARATRETAETVEKERIRELNDRFKDL